MKEGWRCGRSCSWCCEVYMACGERASHSRPASAEGKARLWAIMRLQLKTQRAKEGTSVSLCAVLLDWAGSRDRELQLEKLTGERIRKEVRREDLDEGLLMTRGESAKLTLSQQQGKQGSKFQQCNISQPEEERRRREICTGGRSCMEPLRWIRVDQLSTGGLMRLREKQKGPDETLELGRG